MNNTIQQNVNTDLANSPATATADQNGSAAPDPSSTKTATKPKKAKTVSGKRPSQKPEPGTAVPASGTSAESKSFRPGTKAEIILRKLKTAKGVTLEELVEATDWRSHSVRGFLSGPVKKKLGLELLSETGKDGTRRYRIANGKSGS